MTKAEQSRRLAWRFKILQQACEHTRNVARTCRHFGISRQAYYRWKRRRAAKKFEVYMRSQGRTVMFDGSGKQIDEDHDDKKRWN